MIVYISAFITILFLFKMFQVLGNVLPKDLNGLGELFLIVALVKTLENVPIHLSCVSLINRLVMG